MTNDSTQIPLTIDSRQVLSALRRDYQLSDSATLEVFAILAEDAIGKPWEKARKGSVPESESCQHFAVVTKHVRARWDRLAEMSDLPVESVVAAVLTPNAQKFGRKLDIYHPSWRRLMLRLRE